MASLYEMWGTKNPRFETHFGESLYFEQSLLRKFTNYGIGDTQDKSDKGKIFGAGYELYIYAFFIGLYSNKRKELVGDTKVLGHAIQKWGNAERGIRKEYSELRNYIFIALIAKTDLDLIALEKDETLNTRAVSSLIHTMEQYANYGFYKIKEKLKQNSDYFFGNTGFLDMILDLVNPKKDKDELIEDL
jgi:hypothetical protein